MKHDNDSNLLRAEAEIHVIDLFCGCGGFSLGLARAGFRILAAIDSNAEAIITYQRNLPHVPHVLQRDLTTFHAQELDEMIGGTRVDVIVGGPPCQGFSTARQRDGANHGQSRLIDDKRRYLYQEFLHHVDYFRPRLFVMENVLGIRSAEGGKYFTNVQQEARQMGYRVHSQIENAWELGVPQKRHRQLIFGVRTEIPRYFVPKLNPAPQASPKILLGAAIGDLPVLRAGSGEDECEYDLDRREQHLSKLGENARKYLFEVLEIEQSAKLTHHVARPHSDRDLRDFALLREGESSAAAMRERGVVFEFPYDKSRFKDRYTRQSRKAPCSTIVAHLSKDGLMFIHPTQNRSLTPREAARIQSFPDWFQFPVARTHSYRMIGNAVPPLIAEAIGLTVKDYLYSTDKIETLPRLWIGHDKSQLSGNCDAFNGNGKKEDMGGYYPETLPFCWQKAVNELDRSANLNRRQLRGLSKQDFLRYWHAFLFLFPSLHPNNALDHGEILQRWLDARVIMPSLKSERWYSHVRSGWPLALELLGQEAWRRYEKGEFDDEDFYCDDALRTGLKHAQQD